MVYMVGKIIGYIIQIRIEVESILADNQYGLGRGRSTLYTIVLVVNTAKEATAGTRWNNTTKKYCLLLKLDIRNAFY